MEPSGGYLCLFGVPSVILGLEVRLRRLPEISGHLAPALVGLVEVEVVETGLVEANMRRGSTSRKQMLL